MKWIFKLRASRAVLRHRGLISKPRAPSLADCRFAATATFILSLLIVDVVLQERRRLLEETFGKTGTEKVLTMAIPPRSSSVVDSAASAAESIRFQRQEGLSAIDRRGAAVAAWLEEAIQVRAYFNLYSIAQLELDN